MGVTLAAGVRLLWEPAEDRLPVVAMPAPETPGPFNSPIRDGRSGTTTPGTSEPASPSTSAPAKPPEPTSATTESTSSRSAPTSTTTTESAPPSPRTTTEAEPPSTPRSAANSLPGEVVRLVNAERARAGCDAVETDPRLAEAAQRHSDDMARRGYFSHDSPEGESFDRRIREAGYPRPGAENIAMGQSSAKAVMDAWMDSPGHRRNILNCDLSAIGVGVTTSGWYWTQDFGY